MQKLWVAILLSTVITGCNFSKKADNESSANITSNTSAQKLNPSVGLDTITINGRLCKFDSITKAEFDAVKETEPDTGLPAEIRELKEGLRISFKNGDSLFLQNVVHIDSETHEVTDDVQQYVYNINYPNTDYWLISIRLYEGEEFLLINKQNGKQAGTIDIPKLSPNAKLFASAHYDMSGENANGLDLYKIVKDSLQQIFAIYPLWGADDVKWKDDNTLYLQQSSWAEVEKQKTRYVKLDLSQLKIE